MLIYTKQKKATNNRIFKYKYIQTSRSSQASICSVLRYIVLYIEIERNIYINILIR